MAAAVGGIARITIDGVTFPVKGNWTFNVGGSARTTVVGADAVHGFAVVPAAPFMEGAFTWDGSFDPATLREANEVTAAMDLPNGKTFVLRDAWFAGEGDQTTEEGEMAVRLEGLSADII